MITAKQFYKGALLLPLVVPVLAVVRPLFTGITGPTGWAIGMGFFFGGIVFPYLIFLLFIWIAVNMAETPSSLHRVIYKAPLLFLLAVFIVGGFFTGLLPMAILGILDNDWTLILFILRILGYALLFGYAYVLLIQVLYHVVSRLGWIRPWEVAAGASSDVSE